MSKSVFITTTDSYSGKSIVSLGIMQMILQKTTKVAYYRPIIDDPQNEKKDNHIATIVDYFDLDMNYEEAYAFNRKQVIELVNNGKIDEVLDKIIKQYRELEEKYDFVLIEGTDFFTEASSFDMDLNTSIANCIGTQIILILNAEGKKQDEIISHFWQEVNPFLQGKSELLAVVINKADLNPFDLNDAIKESIKIANLNIFSIPPDPVLALPTVLEIKEALHAKMMFKGEIENMNLVPQRIMVGGMFLQNFIKHIDNNSLALIPGDRADLLVGTLLANRSKNYPKVAGIILTGGLTPERSVVKLIEGIQNLVPIMTTKLTSFQAASIVAAIKSKIQPESVGKIRTSIHLFDLYIDKKKIESKLFNTKVNELTPKMFQYNLQQEAKSAQRHIVLPEGNDERIIKAASQIAREKVAYLTVLGVEDDVMRIVNRLGIYWSDDRIRIINPKTYKKLDEFTNTLFEQRKDKGMHYAKAQDLMQDPTYFGTMMVYKGLADGMVSGADHSTSHTIRPAFQIIKAKTGFKTISSVFFLIQKHRVVIYGDCAIVPKPNAEQLAEIAISSANTASDFGINPRVMMLSSCEQTEENTENVNLAIQIIKKRNPNFEIEGPMLYEKAISEKNTGANVFVFSDLKTGYDTFNELQKNSNFVTIGPVIQGLKKPVNDLPREAKVEDIYNTIIITAIQAEQTDDRDSL